jgi:excisionase family DNA binding protein
MDTAIILHSTPTAELRAMIGDVFREELRKFQPAPQAPNQQNSEYLSRREVCDKLKISPATLHYWTKAGTLQGYRIGGRVLYKTVEVDTALRQMANVKNQKRRA